MKGEKLMSTKELNRIEVLEKLKRKEMTQQRAGEILDLSTRQIKRLVKKYAKQGSAGLAHKGRGKTSNNKLDQKVLDRATDLIRKNYSDFKPTFAHEKLVENHGFDFSVERLRQEMIREKLWQPKVRKRIKTHQSRQRRACFGELVQMDGSPHDWFEGRAPWCNLNVAIDDAASGFMLEFSSSETTLDYFSLLEKYFTKHGLPLAFYTDRHSIFHVSKPTNEYSKPKANDSDEGLTQFGRAMKELGVELILANSPQAKGRVEKINFTLQDRLVKELRLRNISSIKEANKYLSEFSQDYMAKFSVEPRSSIDMHRQLPKGMDLSKILCLKDQRTLSKNITCQHQGITYQIQTNRSTLALRGMRITIRQHHNGTITLWDNQDKPLKYTIFKKAKRIKETDSKELNQVMDQILSEGAKRASQIDRRKNPWESDTREFEELNLF